MKELGRVVAVETDALWVETLQKTSCGNCSARKGCGQSLLQQLHPTRANHLRVLLSNSDAYTKGSTTAQSTTVYEVGDGVEFSIPDHIIVLGSLLVYLVPIVGLLLGGLLGGQMFAHELAVIASACTGFAIAAVGVRVYSATQTQTAALQAQVVRRVQMRPAATSATQQASVT